MMPTAAGNRAESYHGGQSERKTRRRTQWVLLVFAMSAAVVWMDIVISPFIFFPILFVAPVGCAAWFLGRAAGLGTAVSVIAARFWVLVAYDDQVMPLWAAALNTLIRLVLFLGFAYLVSKIADQKHDLEHRVEELEGILPICAFCKKIRDDEGKWEQLERYVTERSAAEFSHSVCAECEVLHYGPPLAN